MASKDTRMSKQGTAGKRKHVTIPQKIEIIRRLESGKSKRGVVASCIIGSLTVYGIKKWKDRLQSLWHQMKV
jgi:hypothetical protein